MKRVLFFAPYFLPRRRVGSMRPFRFAIHLREFGWQPTVLTLAVQGQHLTEKEARLLEGVEIVTLKPPFDRTVASESQLGQAAGPARRSRSRTSRPSRAALEMLDRQFPVDTWLPLFLAKYRTLLQTVRRVQPDVIWSTGDPWSSLVISQRLVRRLGIPWVADFRDPWTLCKVRTRGQWAVTRGIDRYLERRILRTADVVLFQARQTEEKYRQHYADLGLRTATIYNSYDATLFDDPVDLAGGVSPEGKVGEALSLGFFGRFRAMSPAAPIAEVLSLAKRRHGALAEHIKIHSFGALNEADAAYAAERDVLGNFCREEAVPLEQALSALRRFDLLLLSTDPERDEIIPAKLLEYLAAGRPILSLSRNPEVEDILHRTRTGIQLRDEGHIADLLVESLKAKREHRPLPFPFDPSAEEVRRFEARNTTRELAELFDSVLERDTPGRNQASGAALSSPSQVR